jgi:hypothetical protein
MRRQHWSAPVLSVLLCLASGASLFAQGPAPGAGDEHRLAYAEAFPREPRYDAGGPYVDPDGDPWGQPPPYPYPAPQGLAFGQQGYVPTHHQVSVGPVGGASYQPQMLPYPEISPFAEEQFNQHIVEDGLWMNDSNSRGRQYFFTLQGMYARMRKPGRRPVAFNDDPTLLIPPVLPGQPEFFQPVKLGETAFRHDLKSEGAIAKFGFWNPDDSALVIEGFWITDVSETYEKGGGNELVPGSLRDTHGIPLDDGAFGVTVPFDKYFGLTYSQEAFGLSADWYHTPWLNGDAYDVRLLTGFRYLHIQEKFGFVGADSALTYVVGPDGFVIPGTVGANPAGNPPYESYFDSRVYSHLFGPEIGLQYDLGGERLKLGGHTKIALAANLEKNLLSGDNIGDGFGRGFGGNGINNPFPEHNPFKQRDDTSHVSSIFEQNFFIEANVFGYIPYLRKWQILEEAKVRVDYTFLYASEISRPENNIIYRGLPLYPELKISRSQWHMNNWNFGIIWDF